MNWFDLAIIGVVLLFAVIGIIRGFVKEVLSLTSWILAFWLSFTYADTLSQGFEPYIDAPVLRVVAAFAALFIGSLLVLTIASFLIHKLLVPNAIKGTDRVLGGLFGALKGAVIIAALMLFAYETVLPQESWWRGSLLANRFEPLVLIVKEVLPADMTNRLQGT